MKSFEAMGEKPVPVWDKPESQLPAADGCKEDGDAGASSTAVPVRPVEANEMAQVTMDAVTNFHATNKTIEWQRYLLAPQEISFLQFYRELLGPDKSLVAHTTEAALYGGLDFNPTPTTREIQENEGWTTGLNDLLGRMVGSDDPDGFSAVELRKVLSGLLSAGGMHQDQRKVVLDGCNGKVGLMKMIKELVKK